MTPEMYVAVAVAAFVLLVTLFVVGVVIGGAPDGKAERSALAEFNARDRHQMAVAARRYDARMRERTDIYWNR